MLAVKADSGMPLDLLQEARILPGDGGNPRLRNYAAAEAGQLPTSENNPGEVLKMSQDNTFHKNSAAGRDRGLTRRGFAKTVSAGTAGLLGTGWFSGGCRVNEASNQFNIIINL